MKTKLLFIHGMFQNAKSWNHWIEFFEDAGFECSAPSWPFHHGEPADLRTHPPIGLGRLALNDVVEQYARECHRSGTRPIVIGHGVGGLVAQILANRGLASAAVCISSIAPHDPLAPDWHRLKPLLAITHPPKGQPIYEMTPEDFRDTFTHGLSDADAARAYEETATPDSRQVLRDCLGSAGRVDLKAPHVPLLFIAGDSDRFISAAVNRRNSGHYSDLASVTAYAEFAGRGHFICGAPGWREIAHHIERWLGEHVANAETHPVPRSSRR